LKIWIHRHLRNELGRKLLKHFINRNGITIHYDTISSCQQWAAYRHTQPEVPAAWLQGLGLLFLA
jgi:hypothetical protein